MMATGAGSWLGAFPSVVVTLLVLLGPGAVAARLAGLRGLAVIALAPGITVTTVVIGGILAPLVGRPWNPLTFFLVVSLLWLAVALAGRFLRAPPLGGGDRSLVAGLVGVALAFVIVATVVLPVTGSPESFPQNPDTIFHLGVSQWMLDRGDISTLHIGGFASGSASGFYPGAWHGMVVTIAQLTNASVVVSSSCLALVTAGIIWPLAMVLLARTVFGPGLAVSIAAGVTAVSFSAFPYLLMGYGVLWPNMLGQALLPAALACMVVLSRPGSAPGSPAHGPEVMTRAHAGVGFVALVPGLAVAHPNTLIAFVLLGYLVLAGSLLGVGWRARRDRRPVAVAAFSALVVGTALLGGGWLAATAASGGMRAANASGPENSWPSSMVDTIAFGPRGATPLWALAVLVVAGACWILVRGVGHRWVVIALILADGLYLLTVAVDSPLTRTLTWPWYNNPPRLAALMVLPASLAATAVLSALSAALVPGPRRLPATPIRVAAFVPSLALVLITGGSYLGAHRSILDPYFHPAPERAWVSDVELSALQELSTHVPSEAVVAANPWNGGSYMYVVGGSHMLFPSEKALTAGDRTLLAQHLDDAGQSSEVCAAARRLGVRYALTGGDPTLSARSRDKRYSGIDRVGSTSAFRQVASAGPYRLFELVRCAGS